jgi:hypothetical protein
VARAHPRASRCSVALTRLSCGAQVSAGLKELRDRIGSVKSTKKITDAMKLVAAAKVRRAQAAVLGARPFSENLVKVLYAVNSKLQGEDVDVPLTSVRPVKSVRARPGPQHAERRRRGAPHGAATGAAATQP